MDCAVEWREHAVVGLPYCRALNNVWKRRKVTTETKMGIHNGIIVWSVLH